MVKKNKPSLPQEDHKLKIKLSSVKNAELETYGNNNIKPAITRITIGDHAKNISSCTYNENRGKCPNCGKNGTLSLIKILSYGKASYKCLSCGNEVFIDFIPKENEGKGGEEK